jgi:hypothetical protein
MYKAKEQASIKSKKGTYSNLPAIHLFQLSQLLDNMIPSSVRIK